MDVAIDRPAPETATAAARPVLGSERVAAMDVLRGVAVLGILLMNIAGFAMPFAASFDPTLGGGHTGRNLQVWSVGAVLFEGKMRAIFSMLFGAGMLVLTTRLERRGLAAEAADVYYRRLLWLLAFGLVHAYFIWWGDILFFYAVLGLFLYPLRRLSPRLLIVAGSVLLLILVGRSLSSAIEFRQARDAARSAESAAAAGQSLTEEQKQAITSWNDQVKGVRPPPDELAKETAAYQGSYIDALKQRAGFLVGGHPQWLYTYFVFDIGGMMLLGIALLKLKVFTAELSSRSYAALAAIGYGCGIPLATFAVAHDIRSGFEPVGMAFGTALHAIARTPVALGHVAVVMLICKGKFAPWLTNRLAAVGQTAFSCYVAESLICTTIFYGYGLGLFARLDRFQQLLVVLAVWLVLLAVSPIWLRHFRFGPLEWLWRSLTYLERQPMRVAERPPAAPAAASS